jgi:membrane dipeptidase
MLDGSETLFRNAAADIAPSRTPDEFRQVVESGRIAAVLAVEGGHVLEGKLENLERFFERGVRVFTVTWCNSNELADSSSDENQPHRGLSALGREAVKLMNRLGMIVDVSHAARTTVLDITQASSAPVIASHSGIRALRDFKRNLTDEEIKAIAQNRGVIGVVFLPHFLRGGDCQPSGGTAIRFPSSETGGCTPQSSIEDVLDCIAHICQLVGPDHAALGSDFDGFSGNLPGLEDVSKMPAIEAGLLARGYPEADVRKILGLNFLRVWDAVAAASQH